VSYNAANDYWLVVTTSPQHFTVVITDMGAKITQIPRPGRLRCNTEIHQSYSSSTPKKRQGLHDNYLQYLDRNIWLHQIRVFKNSMFYTCMRDRDS
jgi:hypothetical protein